MYHPGSLKGGTKYEKGQAFKDLYFNTCERKTEHKLKVMTSMKTKTVKIMSIELGSGS